MVTGARIPGDFGLARIARQLLHSGDLEHHRPDIRWMPSTGSVRLQRFPLVVEKLVQLAQRLIARRSEIRFLPHFLSMHFDAGDEVDDLVGCYSWIHVPAPRVLCK
jgi:hypothetical protein